MTPFMDETKAISILSEQSEKIRSYGEGLRNSLPNYSKCLINISADMDECLKVLKKSIRWLKEYERQESLLLNGLDDDTPAPESW